MHNITNNQILLNRLDITGPIDLNTPRCVIEELCLSHRIKLEKEKLEDNDYIANTINTIYESPKETIQIPYQEDRTYLKTICGYVNAEHKGWRKDPLIRAFNFLQSFKNKNNIKEYIKYPVGPQTNDCPESLNACVLYGFCKQFNLQISYDTSIDDMFNLIKLVLVNILYSVKPNSINKLITNDVNQNFIEERKKYSFEEYSELAEIISNRDIRTKANSHLEAIVMSALYYKIDISETENPYNEYIELQKSPYFPLDKTLCERFKETNKYPQSLKNPILSEVFNPNLPYSMYNRSDLYKLCDIEGIEYTYDVFSEPLYTQLQAYCYLNNFYHGNQGNINNEENTFCETVDELSYDEIVVFGPRAPVEEFTFFTYGELRETFQNYRRFQNPQTLEIFDEININKLYLLTQKSQRLGETDDVFEERIALGEEIERVKLYTQNKNKNIRNFLEKYENMFEEEQKIVQYMLVLLLECSMYMRAWDGKGPYPLDSESTNFEYEEQIIVDDRVTQSLLKFEKEIEDESVGKLVVELPLMQYHKESKSFISSTDESEGLTILDRLFIIKGGEDGSINSCIRMSSNKLCATSYYYMRLIGMIMPFDINDVAYIT